MDIQQKKAIMRQEREAKGKGPGKSPMGVVRRAVDPSVKVGVVRRAAPSVRVSEGAMDATAATGAMDATPYLKMRGQVSFPSEPQTQGQAGGEPVACSACAMRARIDTSVVDGVETVMRENQKLRDELIAMTGKYLGVLEQVAKIHDKKLHEFVTVVRAFLLREQELNEEGRSAPGWTPAPKL